MASCVFAKGAYKPRAGTMFYRRELLVLYLSVSIRDARLFTQQYVHRVNVGNT